MTIRLLKIQAKNKMYVVEFDYGPANSRTWSRLDNDPHNIILTPYVICSFDLKYQF